MIGEGALEFLGLVDADSPFLRKKYRCTSCGSECVVTAPDQNFLGGVVPAE
jgi:hypothetical protein